MSQMTITEALAEIKLIENKIQKKQEFILSNLIQIKPTPDPFANQGGSKVVISADLQSIKDLQARFVKIRSAIMAANLKTMATVLNETQTIYEWLVWKKEIASKRKTFLSNIYIKTKADIDRYKTHPQLFNQDGKAVLVETDPNIDYMQASKDEAYVQEMLDKLDGVLSLKNATTIIEV